jgi:DNA-binding MarR family transcriptional regulator
MGTNTSGSGHFRDILDSIRRVVRALRIASRRSEQAVGLSTSQLFVLQSLSEDTPITVNELAARTFTHQSTVSVVAKRLVEKKLVIRQRSKTDARQQELRLSRAGAAMIHRPRTQPAQHQLVKALRAFSPKDQARLAKLLSALVREAGWADDTPHLFFEETAPAKKSSRRNTRKKFNGS